MGNVLIQNAASLADASGAFIERGDILVDGDRIVEVGAVTAERKRTAARRIDAEGFLAAPGLVNAHMHTPGAFSAGRGDRR